MYHTDISSTQSAWLIYMYLELQSTLNILLPFFSRIHTPKLPTGEAWGDSVSSKPGQHSNLLLLCCMQFLMLTNPYWGLVVFIWRQILQQILNISFIRMYLEITYPKWWSLFLEPMNYLNKKAEKILHIHIQQNNTHSLWPTLKQFALYHNSP